MSYQQTLDYLYSKLPIYQRTGIAAYKADIGNIIKAVELLKNGCIAIRAPAVSDEPEFLDNDDVSKNAVWAPQPASALPLIAFPPESEPDNEPFDAVTTAKVGSIS